MTGVLIGNSRDTDTEKKSPEERGGQTWEGCGHKPGEAQRLRCSMRPGVFHQKPTH